MRNHPANPFSPACLLATLVIGFASVFVSPARGANPDFGPNVLIFDPATPGIQEKIDAIFKQQEKNQFGTERYAYLFKPGKYVLDVRMGFYMHAAGLGRSPDDVEITGAVRSTAEWMRVRLPWSITSCNQPTRRCLRPLPFVAPTLANS